MSENNAGARSDTVFQEKPPLARGLAFLYFSGLYYAASGGAILAIITLSSLDPWSLDLENTRVMFGVPTSVTFNSWLDAQQGARGFISAAYRFSTLCMLTSSLLILLIVLLAGKNRNVVLGTQIIVVTTLSLFAATLHNNTILTASRHKAHFATCLVWNALGLVAHLYERFQYPGLEHM